MSFFNFTKITPAAPNDPFVDEAAQLNANWDHADTRLSQYSLGATKDNLETGQEWFDSASGRFKVWDGTAERVPDSIEASWSGWTNLRLLGPRVERPGFTPKWRVNTALRLVEVFGCVQVNSTADPWGTSALQISATGAGEIPDTYQPVGGLTVFSNAAALPTSPQTMSGVYITVEKHPTATNCRIFGTYMGAGGGDFAVLDGLRWWY